MPADGNELMTSAEARVGAVLKGKWKLNALVRVGGITATYAATHRNAKRVVVRVLHPRWSTQFTTREAFVREGAVANTIGHPGVVLIDDDDLTEDGCPFLVMERLTGRTLAQRLTESGAASTAEVLGTFEKVLEVLEVAHEHGVVHGELKPASIVLCTDGRVKIFDFGMARFREYLHSVVGVPQKELGGHPAYMAPERAKGYWDEIDARSDLWATGASMFAMFTGRDVHLAGTLDHQLNTASLNPAPSVLRSRSDLPGAVAELVDRALAYEPSERWQDAETMLRALRNATSALNAAVAAGSALSHPANGRKGVQVEDASSAASAVALEASEALFGASNTRDEPSVSVSPIISLDPSRRQPDSRRSGGDSTLPDVLTEAEAGEVGPLRLGELLAGVSPPDTQRSGSGRATSAEEQTAASGANRAIRDVVDAGKAEASEAAEANSLLGGSVGGDGRDVAARPGAADVALHSSARLQESERGQTMALAGESSVASEASEPRGAEAIAGSVAVRTTESRITMVSGDQGAAFDDKGEAASEAQGGVAAGEARGGVATGEARGGVATGKAQSGVAAGEAQSGVAAGEAQGGVAAGEAQGGVAAGEAQGGVAASQVSTGELSARDGGVSAGAVEASRAEAMNVADSSAPETERESERSGPPSSVRRSSSDSSPSSSPASDLDTSKRTGFRRDTLPDAGAPSRISASERVVMRHAQPAHNVIIAVDAGASLDQEPGFSERTTTPAVSRATTPTSEGPLGSVAIVLASALATLLVFTAVVKLSDGEGTVIEQVRTAPSSALAQPNLASGLSDEAAPAVDGKVLSPRQEPESVALEELPLLNESTARSNAPKRVEAQPSDEVGPTAAALAAAVSELSHTSPTSSARPATLADSAASGGVAEASGSPMAEPLVVAAEASAGPAVTPSRGRSPARTESPTVSAQPRQPSRVIIPAAPRAESSAGVPARPSAGPPQAPPSPTPNGAGSSAPPLAELPTAAPKAPTPQPPASGAPPATVRP